MNVIRKFGYDWIEMISSKIIFEIEKGVSAFDKNVFEWVLKIRFNHDQTWIIYTWTKEPDEKTIGDIKGLIIKSFNFYHNHLYIPPFDVQETDL